VRTAVLPSFSETYTGLNVKDIFFSRKTYPPSYPSMPPYNLPYPPTYPSNANASNFGGYSPIANRQSFPGFDLGSLLRNNSGDFATAAANGQKTAASQMSLNHSSLQAPPATNPFGTGNVNAPFGTHNSFPDLGNGVVDEINSLSASENFASSWGENPATQSYGLDLSQRSGTDCSQDSVIDLSQASQNFPSDFSLSQIWCCQKIRVLS